MEKLFKLKEHHTDVKTEVIAGITTFTTMAYILAVNPNMLGDAGMDTGAVFTATALASFVACLMMGLTANLPFALSAGMGLNAYFAYTICGQMGYSWHVALAAVFVEGLLFILLSLTNVREAVFNAIPKTLKFAVSVGIGLFIAFSGLQNAHIVTDSTTLVSMFSFKASMEAGTFRSEGITVLLASAGVLITAILLIKKVRGNILIGIGATWILGIICQLTGLYVPDPDAGFYSLLPSGIFSMPASMAPTFLKMSFSGIGIMDFITIMLALPFVDMFDTIGTVIGCAAKADMLDEKGKLPEVRSILLSDAVGTTVGAVFGTSTVTTFVESSAGIAHGGRTGLTTIVTGFLFLLSLFLSPIFLAVPSFATAPALIIVGFMMMQQIVKIDMEELSEAIPAFITLIAMPFMYSMSAGISLGIISYVGINLFIGKRERISPLMYVLTVLFVLKYMMLYS